MKLYQSISRFTCLEEIFWEFRDTTKRYLHFNKFNSWKLENQQFPSLQSPMPGRPSTVSTMASKGRGDGGVKVPSTKNQLIHFSLAVGDSL